MSSYDKPGSLDGAIDEAVREMMQVDARPGLRHRVARSISTPPQRNHGFRIGLAALAVVIVVLTSMLGLRPTPPASSVHAPRGPSEERGLAGDGGGAPSQIEQVAEATPAVPPNPLAGPQAVEALPLTSAPVSGRARSGRRTGPSPEAIFGPRAGRVTAASIPAAPVEWSAAETWVELPSPQGGPTAIAPIRIEPIHVAPLTIQPLLIRALPRR